MYSKTHLCLDISFAAKQTITIRISGSKCHSAPSMAIHDLYWKDLPSQVCPAARYPSLQTQSSMEVLPGGEVWFSSGHEMQVLIPPGEPSGL